MSPTDVGTINNVASETQTTYNPTPIKPKVVNITVNPVAHVIMSKTSNGPVYAGQTGTFTITLINNGPNDAKNVIVTDPFITGFTYTPSTGKYDPSNRNMDHWNTGQWSNSNINHNQNNAPSRCRNNNIQHRIRNTNNLQPNINNTTNSSPKDKPQQHA